MTRLPDWPAAVACMLIGFDCKQLSRRPRHHFDAKPVEGDEAWIWAQWKQHGKIRKIKAAALLAVSGKPVESSRWVYTGSGFTRNRRYLAQTHGTLIGSAHDPSSIFENWEGIALGNYGAVTASADAPPVGTLIALIVERVAGGVPPRKAPVPAQKKPAEAALAGAADKELA